MSGKCVLASNNTGKIRELQVLLAPLGFEIVAQGALGIPDADETGSSFLENALIKARHAAKHSGLPAIADDSGLEVEALGGAPGVYSARYAGPSASDRDNIDKLLAALNGVEAERRSARFRCVMVFVRRADDPAPVIAEGVWDGGIGESCRGNGGFGYDPVFIVPQTGLSAAELPPEEKNRLSHRGQAATLLANRLRDLTTG
ncbi:RdgB/HAM1 family non-canonical purine NTP pyrophosphatase [Methylococcus geothermalis]|uniref:dITP/XTP pyrophosphatase n=1 Tax=Methylococcus geothermalis TaxID=2681310 RepID=A0A858Q5C1_9GAMM|nr:RdgB/HAM1 family non-canonical purine NTP pyrophosphatase [Methylococcus geothermalis]QJD29052.1 RdgB/HAM1 family non-canonical purine NTP pyrophosphatase [Methylococcus geothermalis]